MQEFINTLKNHPSPYVRVFVQPRETVREQLAKPAQPKLELLLLALGGMASTSIRLNNIPISALTIIGVLLGMVIVGAAFGVIGSYLMSALISWTGKKFLNGTASSEEIRRAIAWSAPVAIAKLPFVVLALLLMLVPFLAVPLGFLVGAVILTLSIWYIVVYIYALSAATGFAFWKAFWNGALAVLIVVVPLAVVMLSFLFLFGHS